MPESKHPTLDFSVKGKTYTIDFSDITGREAKAFRQAVGTSTLSALQGVSTGELDPLECVAGFKWLLDRRDNSKVEYDDVLGSLTYDDISLDAEAEELEDVPLGSDSATHSPPSPPDSASSPGRSKTSATERSMSSSSI